MPVLSSNKPWTHVQDERLRAAVARHAKPESAGAIEGRNADWVAVAADVKCGRSAAGCQARWISKLSQNVTRGGWTDEEDAALLEMFKSPAFGSWSLRATELGRRFHGGVRRGGGETCARYTALTKKGKVAAGKRASAPQAANGARAATKAGADDRRVEPTSVSAKKQAATKRAKAT